MKKNEQKRGKLQFFIFWKIAIFRVFFSFFFILSFFSIIHHFLSFFINSTTGSKNDKKMIKNDKKMIPNAIEGPPTLQSSVIPAWNYVPQLLGKVTPTSSPIVNAARK